MNKLKASSKCPICGVDTPHEHDAGTVNYYREWEIERGKKKLAEYEETVARRTAVDVKFLGVLQDRIDAAIAAKAKYEAACPCCRIARVSNEFIRNTIGTLVVYNYGWDESEDGNTVRCPECGTCLWDRS